MIFRETPLAGAFIIEPEPHADQRGLFARTYCVRSFAEHGLNAALTQCSTSYNHRRGTLRGLHYQAAPHAEAKLVRCTAGAVFDVIVDLRPSSATSKRWFAIELTAANRLSLYIPEGFAHGFQTLRDDSEVLYQMTEFYYPKLSRGLRWDDATLAITWPLAEKIISERDRTLPYLEDIYVDLDKANG